MREQCNFAAILRWYSPKHSALLRDGCGVWHCRASGVFESDSGLQVHGCHYAFATPVVAVKPCRLINPLVNQLITPQEA